jgi:hypothetical protein
MSKGFKKTRRKGEWKFTTDSATGEWIWYRHINGHWVRSSNGFKRKSDCIKAAKKLGYRR